MASAWRGRGVVGKLEGVGRVRRSEGRREEGGGGLSQVGGVANRACKHAHAAFPWDEASLYARYNTALKTYTLLPCSLNVCSRAHTSWGDEVGREREGGRGGGLLQLYRFSVYIPRTRQYDDTILRASFPARRVFVVENAWKTGDPACN